VEVPLQPWLARRPWQTPGHWRAWVGPCRSIHPPGHPVATAGGLPDPRPMTTDAHRPTTVGGGGSRTQVTARGTHAATIARSGLAQERD
jgi:hypothetical protein